MPTRNALNPDRPPRFDPRAAILRLRRVVVLASSLAILLLLGAAGAASAADGLDRGDATRVTPVVPVVDPKRTIEPITSGLGPARDRAVKTANHSLPKGSAQTAGAIVRGARNALASVAPERIPALILPELFQDPDRIVQSRRPGPGAADHAEPSPDLRSEITNSLAPGASSAAAEVAPVDGNQLLRPQPAPPPGLLDPADATATGGSGAGSGPWLGNGPQPAVRPAWRSGFQPGVPFAIPRGLTPRSPVPPG